jgi:hypothetical protein
MQTGRRVRVVSVHPWALDEQGWNTLEAATATVTVTVTATATGTGTGTGTGAGVVALVVPEWEQDWWSPRWQRWAEANGAEVIFSQGSGVNIERGLKAVTGEVLDAAAR